MQARGYYSGRGAGGKQPHPVPLWAVEPMPTRAASAPPPLEVRAAVQGAGSAFVRAVLWAPQVERYRRYLTEQRGWRRSRALSYKLDLENGMQASEAPDQGQSRMRARNGSGVWVARQVAIAQSLAWMMVMLQAH